MSRGSEAEMVQHDDPVEVRTGDGARGPGGGGAGPAQFLWRGRLWKVRVVLEHREQELPRREVWRVAAGRGRLDQAGPDLPARGVFDLAHSPADGRWQLVAVGE